MGEENHHIVVLCARSDELSAFQDIVRVSKKFRRIKSKIRPTDQLYQIEREGEDIRLLAATCGSMGQMAAAVHTYRLIQQHTPLYIFFVGTAASLDENSIQIGDVIIPRKAVFRQYDKISESGQEDFESRFAAGDNKEIFLEKNILVADVDTAILSADIQGSLSSVKFDEIQNSLEMGEAKSISINGKEVLLRAPKVHSNDDIFSCGMVVDSSSYRDFILRQSSSSFRKLKAIDMESYGFFRALELAQKANFGSVTEGLMVRGISDYAGRKKQTEELPQNWRKISLKNASLTAHQMILDFLCE